MFKVHKSAIYGGIGEHLWDDICTKNFGLDPEWYLGVVEDMVIIIDLPCHVWNEGFTHFLVELISKICIFAAEVICVISQSGGCCCGGVVWEVYVIFVNVWQYVLVVCCGDVVPLGESPWGDSGVVIIFIGVSQDDGGGEEDFCFVGVYCHAESA